jgi:predicted AlkP superfamily phosphohydrolase/phosphomutase
VIEALPEDAITIVMSDHGARPMLGGFCFNDWLIREGYLAVEAYPLHVIPIRDAVIDWSQTTAWATAAITAAYS